MRKTSRRLTAVEIISLGKWIEANREKVEYRQKKDIANILNAEHGLDLTATHVTTLGNALGVDWLQTRPKNNEPLGSSAKTKKIAAAIAHLYRCLGMMDELDAEVLELAEGE